MSRDYFAELYVAGILADNGWNIYFPHRDKGFDFIISKLTSKGIIIRPIQVKGKYATKSKTDKATYGYIGSLSAVHKDMVLVIPYINYGSKDVDIIAYMPYETIKRHSRGFKCEPAQYKCSKPLPRPKYLKYFDEGGIRLLE